MRDLPFTESGRLDGLQVDIRLLFPDLSRHAGRLVAILAAIGMGAATVLLFGWGLKALVDEGFADHSGHYLNRALLALLVVILVLAGASYLRFTLVAQLTEGLIATLRKRLYRRLLALDPAALDAHRTGDLVSRLNTDTTVLQMVMATNLPMAIRHLLTLLGGTIMLFVVSPEMTGIVLLVVPLALAPVLYAARKTRARARDTQSRVGDAGAFAQETLQALRTVQSFVYEAQAARTFDDLADESFRAALRHARIRARLVSCVIALIFGAIGVVLWAGGHRVLDGRLSAGELSAFIFYAAAMAGAVGSLSEAMSAFSQAAGAADRIAALLRDAPAPRNIDAAPLDALQGDIIFRDVAFHYPARASRAALDRLSFTAAQGHVTALVGPSGAGKSTVFALLQAFYAPAAGMITIGGTDIRTLDPHDLRAHIGVVAQEPDVFSLSVAENIRLGRPDATDDEVQRAATQAQAHDFIAALPQGYATPIGERGARLSGGQKQRLAIARAMLKDPEILLLDEATSALDAASEQAVMQAMRELMRGRTVIVIAHRLATVRGADKIIVMNEGKVVAEGTHEQLYGKDGLYTHLAALQLNSQ